ncbi:MAG: energy transducer TonB [Hymenobacteraceae bacterium]|nr:energy transducer TonB [Hymenobacteraceae bacterium]
MAQQKASGNEQVYVIVDKKPEFPGGDEAVANYFKNALASQKYATGGVITLSMVVNKTGQVQDVVVSNGLNTELDAAVKKAALEMPKWEAGKKGNEKVNTRVTLPVVIKASAEATKPVNTNEKPYHYVEQMPQFPGGSEALLKYLQENIVYPEVGVKNNIQGTNYIQFTVTREGSITDIVVLKSLALELDNEAVRVIKQMPTWIPGKQNGRAVPVRYTIPVRFQLPEKK